MSNRFKRLRGEVPEGMLTFHPSSLTGCPMSCAVGVLSEHEYSAFTQDIFAKGSEIHYIIERLNEGARGLLSSEKALKVINESGGYIISGRLDEIWIDNVGIYILDYKTAKGASFYYFLKEPIPQAYILQLSLYAYLFYIHEGFHIPTGVIVKVDRDNIRNTVSRSFDLLPPADMEKWLDDHPAISYLTGRTETMYFFHECASMTLNEKWRCSYCPLKKCPVKNKIRRLG